MTHIELTPEEIDTNWKKYRALLEKNLGDRTEAATRLLDTLENDLSLCPASGRKDYHRATPGGLVEHSLRVLRNAMTLSKAFGWSVPKDSLIIGCLFHDLGKVGTVDVDGNVVPYYVPQTSDWHREKIGEMYVHNKDMQYMTVPQRGVWLCNHFGLRLTNDEYLSILLNDGWVLQENKPYCLKEPLLSHIVMTADYISTAQEKGMFPENNG